MSYSPGLRPPYQRGHLVLRGTRSVPVSVPVPLGHVEGTRLRLRNTRAVESPFDLVLSGGRDRRRSCDLTL